MSKTVEELDEEIQDLTQKLEEAKKLRDKMVISICDIKAFEVFEFCDGDYIIVLIPTPHNTFYLGGHHGKLDNFWSDRNYKEYTKSEMLEHLHNIGAVKSTRCVIFADGE